MPDAPTPALLGNTAHIIDDTVVHIPGFLDEGRSGALFSTLDAAITWQEERIVVFGRAHVVPRKVAWFGDAGVEYVYSGQPHRALGWTAPLLALKKRLEAPLATTFNFVLANLYRDGRDTMGLHADDEPELGPAPLIASLSLGGQRRFRLVRRERKSTGTNSHTLVLNSGDLVVMWGDSQKRWLHGIPRTAKPVARRISLTFRCIGRPR